MAMSRTLSLVTLSAVAVPWAVLLGVSGLWLVFSGPTMWPEARALCLVAGLSLCASGQLVCSVCVADRLFPRGGRAVGWLVEIPSCVMLFIGCVWLCWTLAKLLLAAPQG